ncbi:ABC transporter permease [Dyadobacter bucti]|uniref:ABC transporter permease n=1 Tax=Dyadobacter bucti TaxID=2572203 RepID=UPI0011093F38|nr:ABC transporter permease [Dyadobacter bucti]
MLPNTLKFTLRNLVKHRTYSTINIAGLAIGMAGAIVIFQLVSYHLGFDKHHQKADRIYRVVVDLHLEDGSVEKEKGSAYLLHQTLKKEFSHVENAAYLAHKELTVAVGGDKNPKRFLEKESAAFTNADFFKIFDYEWTEGSSAALDVPNQVVLTEKFAKKYFGSENPVGRYIRINSIENLLVAGILKDHMEQTDIKKDIFVSLPTLKKIVPEYGYEDWGWIESTRETYITLHESQQKKAFDKQMPAFANKYYGPDGKVFHYHLQDLSDVHFNIDYGGKIKYSTIFMLATVGVLLILIACFNFINLSTAQSFKRGKEVGVRKVLGVSQAQIFWLFIQETTVFTFASFLLSLLLAGAMSSVLREWLGVDLSAGITASYKFPLFIFVLLVSVIVLAGIYPAIVISRFNPLRAIKGLMKPVDRNWFSVRKGLVIAQFSISFVLMAVSMVIILQSDYIKNKDLGLDKDLILHINLPVNDRSKQTALKNEILRLKDVQSMSFFRTAPSVQMSSGGSIKFENRDWEKFVARSRIADEDYVKTYGLKLLAGRNPVASDTIRELLINQKLVKDLALKSPDEALGKRLLVGDVGKTGIIVGVLSDFNNTDLYSGIEPTVLFPTQKYYRYAAVKLGHLSPSTVRQISAVWQKQFPENVFEHSFYDEEIARFYQREELAANLTSTFAMLSVFLSCLGLFGLAIFSIEQRTKEIGVRKVLGASVAGITTLLSKDFLQLVMIAIVIASPVAYYFMDKWLKDFAYRIDIQWWFFASAGAISILIAFATIGYQSIKAALKNPVETLKTE